MFWYFITMFNKLFSIHSYILLGSQAFILKIIAKKQIPYVNQLWEPKFTQNRHFKKKKSMDNKIEFALSLWHDGLT